MADASVDVVTTRSVVIYLADKGGAFQEFHRVLRPGGRLSIFEPINRAMWPEPDGRFWGYDVTPVQDAVRKLQTAYEGAGDSTLVDFDERDLVRFAEQAGFAEVRLECELEVAPRQLFGKRSWEAFLHSSETRSLVERGEAVTRNASAYLRAVKAAAPSS